MGKFILSIFLIILMISTAYAGENRSDNTLFEAIFNRWTDAFNHKKLQDTCALFSKNIIADYKGVSQKNYESICNGFEKIFNQSANNYKYSYKLHHVYRENGLAVARITWYLRVFKNNQVVSNTQDEGIDIFEKDKNGHWKIVNYIGYSV